MQLRALVRLEEMVDKAKTGKISTEEIMATTAVPLEASISAGFLQINQ